MFIASVQVDGGQILLIDSGSSSGTLLDGRPISRHELQPGQVFRVGDTEFRFQLDSISNDSTIQTRQRPKPTGTAVPLARSLDQLVGQEFAHYRLDSIISGGHAGMVFKAFDTQKDRLAAVKVLAPDPSHSEEQKDRFVRAMQTMMPVRHPNIVRLYHAGKKGPYCWSAMEYVDGESMTDVIQRIGVEGMLDWREVFRVGVHIGRALQEAHERKIIHRNVTPESILRRHSDKVCLLGDLMLAKATEGTLSLQVTMPGQLVGDVAYMSPERTRDGASIDHRSDIYGLGATLYALLTGHPPFENDSLPDLIRMVRQDLPEDPKAFQLSINEQFRDAVMKMLAKHPGERYQTPIHLMKDFMRIGQFNKLDIG